ncbi:MAG: alcohol dehydrogenase catalytic domain-containing protein [Bacteroidetes bacterium]|nr:alcohol dehydrogenase catalytic domain-containing protein [Bacteroidota bacterium]
MKALVKTQKGKGFVELLEVPEPTINDNEVLIEIKACGVCGTDLHIYNDEFPYYPPVILGHEFTGVIKEVGKNINTWEPGDKVVGEPHTKACGNCYLCRTGNPQVCLAKRSPGWGIDGAFAPFMKFPDTHLLHSIPDNMSFKAAALVEPLANVVTDIVLTKVIIPGDIVVVAGPGPIGIMAALVAKHVGAGKVIMLGTNDDEEIRLKLCRELPAIDISINVQKENAKEIIHGITKGIGCDVFVEASGAAPAITLGAELVKKMGKISAIGLTGKEKIEFPYNMLMMKSIEYYFNISTKYDSWDRAIQFLDKGVIPYEKLITHSASIDQWKNVFDDLFSRKGMKAIFEF